MPRHIDRHPQGIISATPTGITSLSGTTVPTDATAGYETGCTFLKTDGTATTAQYVNVGSVTSCNFDIVSIRSQEITDSSGGTARSSVAATVGVTTLTIPYTFPAGTSTAEPITNYVLGYRFKIIGWSWTTTIAGTGAGASRVFNMEIEAVDVGTTPSTLTATLAATATVGSQIAGTTVTGANTGLSTESFSIELATGGTAFTAGSGFFAIKIQNMDVADGFASVFG